MSTKITEKSIQTRYVALFASLRFKFSRAFEQALSGSEQEICPAFETASKLRPYEGNGLHFKGVVGEQLACSRAMDGNPCLLHMQHFGTWRPDLP